MAKSQAGSTDSGRSRRFTRGGGQPADWSGVNAEIIKACIVAAADCSGAVRFGYSGDGGAYALGVYGDGDKPYTEFVRPSEDIEMVLRDLETLFLDIKSEQGKKSK